MILEFHLGLKIVEVENNILWYDRIIGGEKYINVTEKEVSSFREFFRLKKIFKCVNKSSKWVKHKYHLGWRFSFRYYKKHLDMLPNKRFSLNNKFWDYYHYASEKHEYPEGYSIKSTMFFNEKYIFERYGYLKRKKSSKSKVQHD